MDTVSIVFLVAIIIAGGTALKSKDQQKKAAVIALYVLMTLYVGGKYYQSIFREKRLDKASPAIDVDRAELMLRMGSCLETVRKSTLSIPGSSALTTQQKPGDVYQEAEKVLKAAATQEPDSESAWAKLAIVEHERKADTAPIIEHLSKIDKPSAKSLAKALTAVFHGPLPAEEVGETKKVLLDEFPVGWYQDQALDSFYKRTKNKIELDKLEQKTFPAALSLFFRLLGLVVFGCLALLIGVIVIFVQLLFVARNASAKDESELVKAPVYSGPATIYGVFIAWLTTQMMIGGLAQSVMKSISPLLKMSNGMDTGSNKPVLIALTVATLYLVSNAPGTLYAYLLTMRPSKISFLEGFRLRTRIGNRGPVGLVLYGLMTWFAAVPLVLIATIIGVKLGSQGSSNPIIALVMEAARSGNWLSTILFYLTLGVLAPMCEETLFRGFLYANLRRSMGVFPSVVLSAGLFAAFHLDLGAFLPLFTLGCLFALVFEKTKSILPSMVAHGLWNSGTFTLLLLLFS